MLFRGDPYLKTLRMDMEQLEAVDCRRAIVGTESSGFFVIL